MQQIKLKQIRTNQKKEKKLNPIRLNKQRDLNQEMKSIKKRKKKQYFKRNKGSRP